MVARCPMIDCLQLRVAAGTDQSLQYRLSIGAHSLISRAGRVMIK